jgi:hypothetical protein
VHLSNSSATTYIVLPVEPKFSPMDTEAEQLAEALLLPPPDADNYYGPEVVLFSAHIGEDDRLLLAVGASY